VVTAAALAGGVAPVTFVRIVGPPAERVAGWVPNVLGWATLFTALLAAESALGLAFNPRYLDFPTAALSAAVIPLLIHSVVAGRWPGAPQKAEAAMAAILAVAGVKVLWFETIANWQALWLTALFVGLAVTLARAGAARD
jgi:glucan 1,3-beta-glucosidase